MFMTPYETTTLSHYSNEKTVKAIEQVLITREFDFTPLNKKYEYCNQNVLTLNDSRSLADIPIFTQPLLINTDPVSNKEEDEKFIIDCRNFTTTDKNGIVSINKPAIYANHLIGAGLSDFWRRDGVPHLKSLSKLPTKVFSNWVGGVLAKRLNLDEIAQVKTTVIVAFYFCCLFMEFPESDDYSYLEDNELYVTSVKVAYATGMRANDVSNIIKEIPIMRDINELSATLRKHAGTDRFKQLNTALIYSLVGRNGMFSITPETIVAALEYPPLFMAIVFIAGSERGYNKSDIGNIIHTSRNREEVENYTRAISRILSYDY